MGRARLFAVVVLVVLAGCTLPGTPGQFDPDRDPGHVGDYAHDDVFEFDGNEELTKDQLEQVKYRSMARIEYLRGLTFEHDVELEIISRSEYREQRSGSDNASQFTNELWRGAFVVDGDTDVNRAFDDLYGGAVQGYYVSDRVVIVTDDTESIRLDRRVLVHELVHALQDQHFGLERSGETIDERRAELGVIEGEANYVPSLYEQRCGEEWQCAGSHGGSSDSGGERTINIGLFLSIYAPYAAGPTFIGHLHETQGWDAVDRAHAERPTSTSQLIHPDRYPDVGPVDVDLADRSSSEWEPLTDDGEIESETVGEATLFGTLWANGVIDQSLTANTPNPLWYNYSAPETTGWAGDEFRAYTDDDNRTGHVWGLAWDDASDATEFADAYRELLTANDAEPVDNRADTYAIDDDDPFAGAYRVTVTDDRVEIVGAPTVGDLDEIHAPSDSQSIAPTESPVTAPSIANGEPTATAAIGAVTAR